MIPPARLNPASVMGNNESYWSGLTFIMAARFDQKEIQRLVEGVPTEAKGGLQGDIDV